MAFSKNPTNPLHLSDRRWLTGLLGWRTRAQSNMPSRTQMPASKQELSEGQVPPQCKAHSFIHLSSNWDKETCCRTVCACVRVRVRVCALHNSNSTLLWNLQEPQWQKTHAPCQSRQPFLGAHCIGRKWSTNVQCLLGSCGAGRGGHIKRHSKEGPAVCCGKGRPPAVSCGGFLTHVC
jgi:hypothetical protein